MIVGVREAPDKSLEACGIPCFTDKATILNGMNAVECQEGGGAEKKNGSGVPCTPEPFSTRCQPQGASASHAKMTYRDALFESIRAAPALRSYGVIGTAVNRLVHLQGEYANKAVTFTRLTGLQHLGQGVTGVADQLVFVVGGGLLLRAGYLELSEFVAVGLYREIAKQGVAEILSVLQHIRMMRLSKDRIADLLTSAPGGETQTKRSRGQAPEVTAHDLTFAYGAFEPPVFQGLSFSIAAGGCAAVAGPSGIGKSTLAKIVLGLLSPASGSVRVANREVGGPDAYDAHFTVGAVLQDDCLLTGTIRDNIAMFRNVTFEEVVEAARCAQVHDTIMASPMKYDTLVSDQFSGFSGGQRQRILLARAFCGSPSLLVLDEATSALDSATERLIFEAMRGMEATKIVFAHRRETRALADHCIELNATQSSSKPETRMPRADDGPKRVAAS